MLAVTDDGAWIVQTPRIPIKANGSGDVTAALFTAHYRSRATRPTRSPAPPRASSTCSAPPTSPVERELQLVESQESYAHPAMQFEVPQVR